MKRNKDEKLVEERERRLMNEGKWNKKWEIEMIEGKWKMERRK